jgi:hypothetical protein
MEVELGVSGFNTSVSRRTPVSAGSVVNHHSRHIYQGNVYKHLLSRYDFQRRIICSQELTGTMTVMPPCWVPRAVTSGLRAWWLTIC